MGTYKTDSSINRSHGILKTPQTEAEFIRILDHFVGRHIELALAHFGNPKTAIKHTDNKQQVYFSKSANSFNSNCGFTINALGTICDYSFTRT
ncbi:hypothetical protein [Pseudoalteromonas piscicida]|uniref:Uncharacterized protein n=1 Tax=Pseudoalteromonas piscicida TaxID=43662 RepID=A0AAD0RJX9_PSEO7|nr:hypothetical protein [Pseudoalteromonas piscicida]ASD66577.1 hypothetical protein B1L02_05735 [Pseudoalteromonas piscicida]AXQ97502.1 hypothetical protein D0N37_06810 [Pseudoalteromonas piscicida]AXR02711.1 hypothetical protein D0511_12040 [Pseudoalteromonas piscicida]